MQLEHLSRKLLVWGLVWEQPAYSLTVGSPVWGSWKYKIQPGTGVIKDSVYSKRGVQSAEKHN